MSSTSRATFPGASFLDVDEDLAAPPGKRGRHPLPEADDFAAAASRAGIGEGVFVVAYGNMGGAERLWWLLRHFGHDACGVIDFEAWLGPLQLGEEEIEPAVFVPGHGTTTPSLPKSSPPGSESSSSVDARLAERFRGEPNPIDKVPGRIPGAVNAPWNEPLPELPEGELVAYCGSGVTSCVTLHRLALAGREGKLYPGSWSEWEQLDFADRARLGRRLGGEVRQVLTPAVRNLRRGEADEEHGLRRPRRLHELHRDLLEEAVALLEVAGRARGDDVLPDGIAPAAARDDVVEREPPVRRAAVDATPAVAREEGASRDLPLHGAGHAHVLHEPDHVRPLEGVAGRTERLVELLEHLGLALEHEHVCTTHGCDVQWLVARVQDEYL